MNIHHSHIISKHYDVLYSQWRHKRVSPILSNIVAAFFIAGLIIDGSSLNSFHTFFNVLVFTDVLILIYSLRFSSKYINLFRYSSYTFATIILRLSLTAPAFYNVALCLLAGLFVLAVTYVYNYLTKKTVPGHLEPEQLNII